MADMNEIEAAAHAAKRVREAADKTERETKSTLPLLEIGIGLGVGSAALAAALLYASRSRKDK
ncbi:MAG: hypothetical protein B7Y45_11200 [Sphingomonas sp. 28-66-16]|nr:MAG: hypothetical protein B7Y45_11200 [Sphingomonas sp. 28-66-16]